MTVFKVLSIPSDEYFLLSELIKKEGETVIGRPVRAVGTINYGSTPERVLPKGFDHVTVGAMTREAMGKYPHMVHQFDDDPYDMGSLGAHLDGVELAAIAALAQRHGLHVALLA